MWRGLTEHVNLDLLSERPDLVKRLGSRVAEVNHDYLGLHVVLGLCVKVDPTEDASDEAGLRARGWGSWGRTH